MNVLVKQIIAGGLGGLVTTGNALVTVLMETAYEDVSKGQWVVMFAVGFIAAFMAWKTLLTSPPK